MFIEIRKLGIRRKYYLVHTYRVGFRIRKVRVYLGIDLNKRELSEAGRQAIPKLSSKMDVLKQVRDPYKTALSSKELEELKTLEPAGRVRLIHFGEEEWQRFTESFSYDTNAIEGSTMDKKEVRGILEENRWPDKSKQEISETFGVADAVKYIRNTKEHFSIDLIKKLHKIVFMNSELFAGKLRKIGEEVAVLDFLGNIVHRGAPSTKVPFLLKELVEWYQKNKSKYPPLILAAIIHNQFESIHPFRDGNGRVGRLLLINILLKHKLPPVNIELENRSAYYAALQGYQTKGDIRPMIALILREYRQLKNMIKKKG